MSKRFQALWISLALLFLGGCSDPAASSDTGSPQPIDAVVFADATSSDTAATTGPPADTSVANDTGDPCLGDNRQFLCPCDFNSQCASGYCIAVNEDEVEQRCTKTCTEECPEGWQCREIAGGGDPIYICVPLIDTLCSPCFVDEDCKNLGDLCLPLEGASFCGRDCSIDENACPEGFTCTEIGDAMQCQPDNASCLCPPSIDTQTDPNNCGSCGKVCELPNAQMACSGGNCIITGCEDGFHDLDGDAKNGCEYECTKTSDDDVPDMAFIDANCDGIDGDPNQAIFVAPYGSKNNPGTMDKPINTVLGGIAKAITLDKPHVYVAAGTYSGEHKMVAGVSVFGGYSADEKWSRNTAVHETILMNEEVGEEDSIRVVIFADIKVPTYLAGVTVAAGNNPITAGSSYGIWMHSISSDVTVRNCRVVSGNGAPGTSFPDQPKGADGLVGGDGKATTDTDCLCNEFDTFGGKGGVGAASTCEDGVGSGGGGADSSCGNDKGNPGSPSSDGTTGGTKEKPGADGTAGEAGTHGEGGSAVGTIGPDGFWKGNNGLDGGDGNHGLGGGGGGSGDGHSGGLFGCGSWGGGGGGGGSGGCGGLGATGGLAGGASFAIILYDASPTLIACTLSHKSGGNGGNGGVGGIAGSGKPGGLGGSGNDKAGPGGNGGHGGNGGAGGNGGGGAGGSVYGLFSAGESKPTCEALSFQPLGVAGLGGIGGNVDGNAGQNGQSGDMNLMIPSCK